MNIIKKGFLATAAAATLAFGAAGNAQAHAYGDSILNITNFRLLSGGTPLTEASFTSLVVSNTRSATAQLNNTFDNNAAGPACVGACPGPATFAPGAIPAVLTTIGFGNTEFSGSALDDPGATARTRALASVGSSPNFTSGNANTGTTTSFVFTMAAAGAITVEFDADAYTAAYVPVGATETSVASARLSWSINIVDLDDPTLQSVFNYAPTELNALSNVSRSHADPGLTEYSFTDFLTATSANPLAADRSYQLTVQHSTFADALQEEVPEPATLAIIAAGLLSMSLVSRRRKS